MNARKKMEGNVFSPLGSGLGVFCLAYLAGKSLHATALIEIDDVNILMYAVFYGALEYSLSKSSFNQSCFFSFASPHLRRGFDYLTEAVKEDYIGLEGKHNKTQ